MPRYRYRCSRCDASKAAFHLISETLSDCDECEGVGTMEKLVSTPHIKKEIALEKDKVGEITKEYIEANREVLEQQKQEAKEENYEPT